MIFYCMVYSTCVMVDEFIAGTLAVTWFFTWPSTDIDREYESGAEVELFASVISLAVNGFVETVILLPPLENWEISVTNIFIPCSLR